MRRMEFAANPERINDFTRETRAEYDRTTVIDKATRWRPALQEENGGFVRIGQRFYADPQLFVKEFWQPGMSYSPAVVGVGQSITIGEEKYVISRLERESKPREVSALGEVAHIIESDYAREFSSAFLPLDYYRDVGLGSQPEVRISFEKREQFISFGKARMFVFWSSKYVPFRNVFLVGRDAAEWIAKPDPMSGHRVRVEVKPRSDIGKFDVICETVAKLKLNPNHIFAFVLPKLGNLGRGKIQ